MDTVPYLPGDAAAPPPAAPPPAAPPPAAPPPAAPPPAAPPPAAPPPAAPVPAAPISAPRAKTQGEIYEGIAFTFCKAATIILITGPLALPIASGAATVFYLLAHRHGQTASRCILGRPLVIAAFWGTICVISLICLLYLALKLRPWLGHFAVH